MSILRRTVLAGLAALSFTAGVAGSSAPAAAWYRGGWGAPVAAGVLGGLAAGAIIGGATHPYGYGYPVGYGYPAYGAPAYGYGPEPVYDACYRSRRPVYDGYGNFAGYRSVRVCN